MRQVVGGRAVDAQAASASQMGRFETETLALAGNRAALADLNGQWIDRFHDRNGLKYIVLDMDSSVSPTHGDQEGSAWNGHFDCSCYHPNFLFNQFGMLERCALRHGNVHSADGWRDVLDPVIARYAERDLGGRFFRADAAYAIPAIYERLEEARFFYAIRLPANAVLKDKIAHRLTRPVGRPSLTKVKRFFEEFEYQAASWDKERRVIAKIEWHPGELFPRVGFIVTNLPMEPDWVVRFYNQRGTAEQHIKEGKYAFRWTRLSCRKFRDNEVRLQLHALAYNLATFLRCIELPEAMADSRSPPTCTTAPSTSRPTFAAFKAAIAPVNTNYRYAARRDRLPVRQRRRRGRGVPRRFTELLEPSGTSCRRCALVRGVADGTGAVPRLGHRLRGRGHHRSADRCAARGAAAATTCCCSTPAAPPACPRA
jgi:hypothetical protein